MRKIKFRGRRIDNGKWVYGYFVKYLEGCRIHYVIITEEGIKYYVNLETVGQYTGLKDENGQEIYEGDRVRAVYDNPFEYQLEHPEDEGIVIWNEEFACFSVRIENETKPTFSCFSEFEIIGDIYI